MKFNIRHALLIAIGLNRNSRDLIDKIYSENEPLYYSIYIKSDFFNDCLKNMFTIKTQESINKLIGIIEYCYAENNFMKIESLIKTVHPSILKYVKTAKEVNLDVFRDKYLKAKINDMSEVEIFSILICLIYTGMLYNRDVIGSSTSELAFKYWEKLLKIVSVHNFRFELSNKNIEEYKEEVSEIYDIFNRNPDEDINEDRLSVFLENYIEEYVAEKCKENMSFEEYVEVRSESFNQGIIKYIGSFSRLLNVLGLDDMDASVNIKFNKDIFNLILSDYINGKYGNNLTEEDKGLYIVASLFMYNLVELYNEAKELYLNKSKEEKYKDLKTYEDSLIKEKEVLQAKETKYKKELSAKKNEIEELKKKVKNLEKTLHSYTSTESKNENLIAEKDEEINILKEENAMLINNIKELNSLRVVNDVDVDEMVKYINTFKIGIFGGKKSIKGLSEVFNNITYYESLTQDITSIKNLDFIFINADFFNHAFSKKVISYKNKFGIPFGYIGGTNKELIIKQMYKYLKNEKDM